MVDHFGHFARLSFNVGQKAHFLVLISVLGRLHIESLSHSAIDVKGFAHYSGCWTFMIAAIKGFLHAS
jgi:hypothetical protein